MVRSERQEGLAIVCSPKFALPLACGSVVVVTWPCVFLHLWTAVSCEGHLCQILLASGDSALEVRRDVILQSRYNYEDVSLCVQGEDLKALWARRLLVRLSDATEPQLQILDAVIATARLQANAVILFLATLGLHSLLLQFSQVCITIAAVGLVYFALSAVNYSVFAVVSHKHLRIWKPKTWFSWPQVGDLKYLRAEFLVIVHWLRLKQLF